MPNEDRPELATILEKIREARNFDFRNYKRATLIRRIERRMSDRRCKSWKDYVRLLEREPEEFDALIASMLIKVTSFFRDEEVWQHLSTRVIPHVLAHKRPDEELRIWSAGCATGEEAFSIAITIAEVLGPAYPTFDLKVFGTDVDEAAIAFARRGVYSAAQVQNVPKPMLERWFTPAAEGYAVRKEIRRVVVFGVNNLTTDAPISRLDLILCRNVFIYMDGQLQKRVLTRFHYALRRDGYLVLGRSELIPFAARVFDAEDLSHRIYRKDGSREMSITAQERLVGLLEQERLARVNGGNDDPSPLGHFYRDALDSLPLPIVGTALDGSVTLWNTPAARLWNRAESEVLGKKLAALALPGLGGDGVMEKATLVREGKSDHETAEATLNQPGRPAPVTLNVEVIPLRDGNKSIAGILYVMRDYTTLRGLEADLRRVNEELRAANEMLTNTNERMRTANEELETTNEELQSANEELQTTNEELQSTNEELETTNEELQSANAELDATNRELAHRTEEMNLLGLYQRTIIRSLSAAVVVVDANGRITSWNLAAERLLGIPESEAVGQILWTLRVPALKRAVINRVRKALGERRALRIEDVEYELPTGGGGHATMAAVPLVDEETTLGAVILFEDTTRAVSLAEENTRLKHRLGGKTAGQE